MVYCILCTRREVEVAALSNHAHAKLKIMQYLDWIWRHVWLIDKTRQCMSITYANGEKSIRARYGRHADGL